MASKKIYVGNLPYSATEEDLREMFSEAGEVQSVKIINDESGRSKGFGFIEMATNEEAEKAIASFNGKMLKDRALNVSEARPQTARPGGDRPRQGRPFGREKGPGRWR
ncbi:MAG: RNA-binding protein [Nitrospiraceae bacterium]|nr:RNA-binding protein [Nitrospiraceae bacterium]